MLKTVPGADRFRPVHFHVDPRWVLELRRRPRRPLGPGDGGDLQIRAHPNLQARDRSDSSLGTHTHGQAGGHPDSPAVPRGN